MKPQLNATLMKLLEDKQFQLDELGRVIIDDPLLLEGVKSAFGGYSSGIPDPLWNAACTNSRCS